MKLPLFSAHAALGLIVILLLTSTCGAAEYPLTITDSAEREVTFTMPAERIIVLNMDAAEAVSMLGAADKVVGVSELVKSKGYYFPDLKDKQSVGKWNAIDYEMIGEIASEGKDAIVPDIVVIGYSYPGKSYGITAVEEGLKPFGNINALALDFTKPEDMTGEIELLGLILGKEEEASDFIRWHNEKMDSIKDEVQGLNMPRVYVEWSSTAELATLGPGSGFDQVLSAARGSNIARSLSDEYPKVGWEWVVSENPETIIRRQTQSSGQTQIGWQAEPSTDTVKLESIRNELMARPGAEGIDAVKSDRVYIMDWDVLNGLDQAVGATYVAKLLHPEVDLDPVKIHREYLERLGLEYPDGRTLVYPEIENLAG